MAVQYEGASEAERRELERVGAFSDGVFAIAITLLVLTIEVPSGDDLADGLRNLDDDLLAYFIGFAVMGRFWYAHHKLFSAIVRTDSRLIVVNLVLLSLIALMPFATGLLGSFDDPLAVTIYALNVAAAAVASGMTELVAFKSALAPPEALDDKSLFARANGWVATIFLLSIPVAYIVGPAAGQLSWLLLLLLPRLERPREPAAG